MGTIIEKLSFLNTIKNNIRNAIINKDVSVPSSTPFSDYPSLISQIKTGGDLAEFEWHVDEFEEGNVNRRTLNIQPGKMAYAFLQFPSYNYYHLKVTLDNTDIVDWEKTNDYVNPNWTDYVIHFMYHNRERTPGGDLIYTIFVRIPASSSARTLVLEGSSAYGGRKMMTIYGQG